MEAIKPPLEHPLPSVKRRANGFFSVKGGSIRRYARIRPAGREPQA